MDGILALFVTRFELDVLSVDLESVVDSGIEDGYDDPDERHGAKASIVIGSNLAFSVEANWSDARCTVR